MPFYVAVKTYQIVAQHRYVGLHIYAEDLRAGKNTGMSMNPQNEFSVKLKCLIH